LLRGEKSQARFLEESEEEEEEEEEGGTFLVYLQPTITIDIKMQIIKNMRDFL